mmetsp:Transcript_11081/g.16755  ORF Transcript_11081/g.16755 Transcript_11081/m.16755 type:complete len:943 (+) Transcript_11081:245-3073(+)
MMTIKQMKTRSESSSSSSASVDGTCGSSKKNPLLMIARRRGGVSPLSFLFFLCFHCTCIITLPSTESFSLPNQSQRLVKLPSISTSQLYVSSSPPSSSSSSSSSPYEYNPRRNTYTPGPGKNRRTTHRSIQIKKQKWRNNNNKSPSSSRSPKEIQRRLQNAKDVEDRLSNGLERTRELIRSSRSRSNDNGNDSEIDGENHIISFPSVRECNSALAIMGDTDDFKRALRLFSQMRKSQMIVSLYNASHDNGGKDGSNNSISSNNSGIRSRMYLYPPSPTLVTYSTLMSRAVKLGKERVALRLWRLMILQEQFFTNINFNTDNDSTESNSSDPSATIATTTTTSSISKPSILGAPIVPDIKAVNILMNVFAKMADHESATLLMEQLYTGNVQRYYDDTSSLSLSSSTSSFSSSLIQVVPKLKPNIVTYNTLIDACHRAGDLDAGLDALSHMKANTNLKPDARTYTSLISTVARRDTRTSGAKDPDLAFTLFDEMVNEYKIKPNGVTYCALIDVCGRCGRSDLALKGLRMMLREKAKRERRPMKLHQRHFNNRRHHHQKQQQRYQNQNLGKYSNNLEQEVGAWSAAINACGKAKRLDTAIRLFHSMSSKFGVKPNIITCGCLMDCLLKSGQSNYLEEALNVLIYMKEEGIEPSEVMYTSLITSAGNLAQIENKKRGELVLTDFGDRTQIGGGSSKTEGDGRMKALDVYESLLVSLTSPSKSQPKATDASNNLVKAFLVFQEMKATGADPDIACYNALLRACAMSGDIPKLRDVMRRIEADGLTPNDTTWKEFLRGAAKARESSVAEEIWNTALTYKNDDMDDSYTSMKWVPSAESFVALIASYFLEAADETSQEMQSNLYGKIVEAYLGVAEGDKEKGLHHIDMDLLQENRRGMSIILKAVTFLLRYDFADNEDMSEDYNMYEYKLRNILNDIRSLECFHNAKRH